MKANKHRDHVMCVLRVIIASAVIFLLRANDLYSDSVPSQVEAKKEGRVVYYTAQNLVQEVSITRAFEAKYPGIRVEMFRTGSQSLMTKITNEYRAQRHAFDVVSLNTLSLNTFKEEGILGRYVSLESKEYPEAFKEPEGYWTEYYYDVYVIIYNRKLFPSLNAPKTFEELTNQKWRGKIMMDRTVPYWFAFMIQRLGKENALNLARRLVANDLVYRDGSSLVMQLVNAGEVPLGFPLKGTTTAEMILTGAPLGWSRPEPVFCPALGIGISSKSPHPNAAKLFIDFTLSQTGQENIAGSGKIPARPGVRHKTPKLTEGIVLHKVNVLSIREYEEVSKIYRDVFKIKK